LDQLRIARLVLDADKPVDSRLTGLLFMPDNRRLTLYNGTVLPVRTGDLVAVPIGGLLRDIGRQALTCTMVTGPRQWLGMMPSRADVTVLPHSASVDALRGHVERLRAMTSDVVDAGQVQAATRSIRELLAAITVPFGAQRSCGARREEALLERILKHIDVTLGEGIDIPRLCEALACSRSALYRAVAPQGGLVRIVMQRRLLAVHDVLSRSDDQRSIAQIARVYGFSSASQFSRCFRRTFGISAGGVRGASTYHPANDVLDRPSVAAGSHRQPAAIPCQL
jgi:AraC-like DNA-binding protein